MHNNYYACWLLYYYALAATYPVDVTEDKVCCPLESLNENFTLSGYAQL